MILNKRAMFNIARVYMKKLRDKNINMKTGGGNLQILHFKHYYALLSLFTHSGGKVRITDALLIFNTPPLAKILCTQSTI